MQVNTQTFVEFAQYLHYTWSAPLQVVLAVVILWFYLGVAVFAGIGALILLVPLNGYLMKKYTSAETEKLKQKDNRVKIVNEVLNGIKVLTNI